MIIIEEMEELEDVYDLTVNNVHNFYANDILAHNCLEILLPNKEFERLDDENGRIALCTLGSINWGSFKNPEEMRDACRTLVRSLSNLLNYQDFLSIQSKLANEEFEPLGIGVTNLAYWHAKRGLKYGTPEALAEVKRWMEHQAYYLTEASVELAEEKGPCKLSHTTSYGKGIFPWEKRVEGTKELTDFTPELDWEPLRARMIKSGIKNATLMAIAPVESSSVCVSSTNGIEMPMDLISIKESKAGSLIQVVPEYTKLKNKYQLMWDQEDCKDYLKTAATLAVYCDQSISTNTFYSPKYFPDGKIPSTLVMNNILLAYKWGLRTLYYSLIEKLGSKNSSDSIGLIDQDSVILETEIHEDDDGHCDSCVL